jgi:hypothetical protein
MTDRANGLILPKRAVSLRRENDEFVVSSWPHDVVIFRNSDARSDYPFRQHFSAATFRREASLCEQSDAQSLPFPSLADCKRHFHNVERSTWEEFGRLTNWEGPSTCPSQVVGEASH